MTTTYLSRTAGRARTRPQARVVVALGVTLLVWGSAFVAIRVALRAYGPTDLAALRLVLAGVLLAALSRPARLRLPERADLGRIVAVGVVGMALYQVLLNAGEVTVDAGTASVLVATQPVFAAILARLTLNETIGPRRGLGIAVAFGGASVIAAGSGGTFEATQRALLVLAAAAALGSCFVIQKPLLRKYTPLEVTAYATWVGALCLAPALLDASSWGSAASAEGALALLWLTAGGSVVGWICWSYVLARVDVAVAATWLYLGPIVALLVGWVILDEVPSAAAIFGGILVIGGVALATRARPEASGRGVRTTYVDGEAIRSPRNRPMRFPPV